ncbi:(-)-isopiperitenol/(-)-carveol dehydrogenase, mitochondrial-like [Olea europaea var. sylvestris]|uniref:(-)-isopiperitenol (-)-carveol dehydrogenase, mitochondrial-like n=1 Tax=Olea europaea subsp. europaea TaxID=158383 RepID=A0A8S0TE12_OLEEU|nr:(-)-isopiperitenol/(-)-carveol dehydrogenase, mitochondrial-like [Olea europaea var. sylvestris]CAA3001797.1 (-)-isopiperitenol (-)-carveol dehydrogenase, mitochondrial-like [Olea europaea subsp. europaea]
MAHSESALPLRKLQGKVAIVTGGASGIGEATARLFADHGVRAVVIADVQDNKGQIVAESIGGERCSYVHCDSSDEKQVKAMVDFTVEKYDQLDIMFSNAGVPSKSEQTILDLNFSQFDTLFGVNVHGMAACVKHAARAMVEKGVKGTIVCTASAAATNCRGGTNMTDYVMSKHAILGLVRAASQQLGVHGIRVNCVSPSAIATPMAAQAGLTSEGVRTAFGPFTPLKGTTLTVNHIADAVLFLASNNSAFVTGHDLVVDGGLISLPHLMTTEN